MMFRQSGDRRKLMDARAASGDIAPLPERRRKDTSAPTVDATGRAIPLPSKRYTPPKYRPPSPAKTPPPTAAKGADGGLTATRILVGKDGLTPPM